MSRRIFATVSRVSLSLSTSFFSNLLFLDLEEPERPLAKDPLPSEQDMKIFRDHLEQLRNIEFARLDRMMDLRSKIKEVMAKLEILVLKEYDNKDLSCVEIKPTLLSLKRMNEVYQSLCLQFEEMKNQIVDMRKRLSHLWKFLEISENHQRKFVKYTEFNQNPAL